MLSEDVINEDDSVCPRDSKDRLGDPYRVRSGSFKVIALRESERSILEHLLERHIDEGSYFGNKTQHYKMCKKLMEKIEWN